MIRIPWLARAMGLTILLLGIGCRAQTRAAGGVEGSPTPRAVAVVGRQDPPKTTSALAPVSQALVRQLPDVLLAKAYLSTVLPPEQLSVARSLRRLLAEYAKASGGKFRWEVIDPDQSPARATDASRCNVKEIITQSNDESRITIQKSYLGVCLCYIDKQAAISQVVASDGLEYQLSLLIRELSVGKKKVAFTTGHGESDLRHGFQAFKQDVEAKFDVVSVNPSLEKIGADVDIIVVGGPQQPMDEQGERELDRFIMTGKGAVVLAPTVRIEMPSTQPVAKQRKPQRAPGEFLTANPTGLARMLAGYGFKVSPDVVVDPEAAMFGVFEIGHGRRALSTFPLFVAAAVPRESGFRALEGLRGVVFPYPSPVELVGPLAIGQAPAGGTLWALAASSPTSWTHAGAIPMTPDAAAGLSKPQPGQAQRSSVLGYAYQGPLKSAFSGDVSSISSEGLAKSIKPARLVVVGNVAFAHDSWTALARLSPVYAAGAQLLFNALVWMGEDDDLASLRSRTIPDR